MKSDTLSLSPPSVPPPTEAERDAANGDDEEDSLPLISPELL
jgi:hypothetical protein